LGGGEENVITQEVEVAMSLESVQALKNQFPYFSNKNYFSLKKKRKVVLKKMIFHALLH